jgi:heme/copper-type cytochrome/quinol oxidase subunit 2
MQILGCNEENTPSALLILAVPVWPATASFAQPAGQPSSSTSIFSPASTPAHTIFRLSLFVLAITAAIFLRVFVLLVYSAAKFRMRANPTSTVAGGFSPVSGSKGSYFQQQVPVSTK